MPGNRSRSADVHQSANRGNEGNRKKACRITGRSSGYNWLDGQPLYKIGRSCLAHFSISAVGISGPKSIVSAHYSPFPSTLIAMSAVDILWPEGHAINDFKSKRFAECE
jgi:hypothetical protein